VSEAIPVLSLHAFRGRIGTALPLPFMVYFVTLVDIYCSLSPFRIPQTPIGIVLYLFIYDCQLLSPKPGPVR